MKREIINIDEELCNGCGLCIPNCHEGALQIIDDKAVLISDLMCDGLGACIGHCPEGAITIEKREAQPYDEVLVMKEMVVKGPNVVLAHLQHMIDHKQDKFLNEGIDYLNDNKKDISFNVESLIAKLIIPQKEKIVKKEEKEENLACGCPGSLAQSFDSKEETSVESPAQKSELSHWPVQLHLINPAAEYFHNADLVIAADCTAFAAANFHQDFLKGKKLCIACPKLDSHQETYEAKIKSLIEDTKINTISVIIMEVPCCGGLLRQVKSVAESANRKIPVKLVVLSIQGKVIEEEWV